MSYLGSNETAEVLDCGIVVCSIFFCDEKIYRTRIRFVLCYFQRVYDSITNNILFTIQFVFVSIFFTILAIPYTLIEQLFTQQNLSISFNAIGHVRVLKSYNPSNCWYFDNLDELFVAGCIPARNDHLKHSNPGLFKLRTTFLCLIQSVQMPIENPCYGF